MNTAAQTAAAVRSGDLTARQAVEDALVRIEASDNDLGAYQKLRVFAALHEADAVDARPDRGELPLAGVPVAIKDNIAVQGEPMRVGSAATDAAPQAKDHEVVRRLRAAGAVVVGLTRCPELCVFGTTDSTFGVTRNPWDLTRTPGGSSGGSAAAVAAGTVAIAHANDGMGSIRIPAACCGIVGLKPGFGVVPADLGNGSWFGMAENGPLATTVGDAALMLSVLAARPEFATITEPGRLRVAVSTKPPAAATPLDPHWAAATRETGDLLASAGHAVTVADPPYGQTLVLSEVTRWAAGTELDAQLVADRSQLDVRVGRHAALGRALLRAGLPREKGRMRWLARAERFFDDCDVLLTPTLAQPPVAAKAWSRRGWTANIWSNARYAPFAAPWNLAGWPAMAVPAGLDPNGLPLSVQLVGRPGSESMLLAVAAQLEQLRPWLRTAPER
ncbi:MAG: amidase family protein [Actinomycetota bacterium]|nr:amidase family protein [Actinomycetota bacterium]